MENEKLTPSQISLLLRLYYRPLTSADHQEGGVGQALTRLMELKLIDCAEDSADMTEKGDAYIEAILALPLPVKVWVMPDGGRV